MKYSEQNKLLNFHIKKCFYNHRNSQKYIFKNYYFYIRSICESYSLDDNELESLINQCFLMVFKNICPDKTEDDVSFQKWLRKQAVCVIVNHTRKNFRHQEIINFKHVPVANPGILWKRFLNKISPAFQKKPSNEIYSAISHLTPFSRIILNLMALEEFTYTDLSNCFDVTFDIAKENADLAVAEIKNIVAPFHAKVTC